MEPETDEKRMERQAKLHEKCEEMGLVAAGDIVVTPLGNPVSIDASSSDLSNLAASLIYLAHQQGIERGRREMREEINCLLGGGDQ